MHTDAKQILQTFRPVKIILPILIGLGAATFLLFQNFDKAAFAREAQVTALLRDPNVVALYSWGEHERRPFAVMEYVSGGSLDAESNRERFRGQWR